MRFFYLSDTLSPLFESDFIKLWPEKSKHGLGLKKVLLFGFFCENLGFRGDCECAMQNMSLRLMSLG